MFHSMERKVFVRILSFNLKVVGHQLVAWSQNHIYFWVFFLEIPLVNYGLQLKCCAKIHLLQALLKVLLLWEPPPVWSWYHLCWYYPIKACSWGKKLGRSNLIQTTQRSNYIIFEHRWMKDLSCRARYHPFTLQTHRKELHLQNQPPWLYQSTLSPCVENNSHQRRIQRNRVKIHLLLKMVKAEFIKQLQSIKI